MKGKYKAKPKKKKKYGTYKQESKPVINILTADFITFDLFSIWTTEGSFKFKEVTNEEVQKILKSQRFKVYIDENDKDLALAIREDLQIRFKKRKSYPIVRDGRIIVVQSQLSADNKIKLKYFDCKIQREEHIDWHIRNLLFNIYHTNDQNEIYSQIISKKSEVSE